MMLALGVGLLLAATPKVAAPGLRTTGVEKAQAEFLSELLATQLAATGVTVVTEKEMATLLGMERQRQLLGCASEGQSQCLAEIANAMGSSAMLIGDLAFFAERYVVNLKIISAADGKLIASRTFEVTTQAELLDALKSAAKSFGEALLEPPAPSAGVSRTVRLVPAAVGVVAVIAGGVLLGLAASKYSVLASGMNVPFSESSAALSSGPTFMTAGIVAAAVGGVALLAGVLWLLLGGG